MTFLNTDVTDSTDNICVNLIDPCSKELKVRRLALYFSPFN